MSKKDRAVQEAQRAVDDAFRKLDGREYAEALGEIEDHCSALIDAWCEEQGLDRKEEGL